MTADPFARLPLAALVAGLAATAPFTRLGSLHASDGRFWLDLAAAGLATAAVAAPRPPVAGALVAGVAIATFAWAATPAHHAARAVAAPAPLDLVAASSGDGVEIGQRDVARLLETHGIPATDVESYVASFYGPIDAETLAPGTTFLRYSAHATGQGRFLTHARFGSTTVAQLGLHLSWFNTASCLATVKVTKRTVALVGDVAFGKPDVKQFVILEPDAFTFGHGHAYTSRACD